MITTDRWGVWIAALALAACGGSAASSRAPAEASEPATFERSPFLLYALPVIGGSEPTPEAYQRGVASFEAGEAAYEAKQYDEAAEEFLDAGLTFHVPLTTAHAQSLLHMSELSCRNAALAWKTIGEIDRVSMMRSDVKEEYPACAAGLEREMPKPPSFTR